MSVRVCELAPNHWVFECPACGNAHGFSTKAGGWSFNGDVERPTVNPSLLVRDGQGSICHSFIRDGKIQFLGDCTHALANQTVEIPEWDSSNS